MAEEVLLLISTALLLLLPSKYSEKYNSVKVAAAVVVNDNVVELAEVFPAAS